MKTSWPARSRALLLLACSFLGGLLVLADEQPVVRVANADSVGPRTLEAQTRTTVVRDYLAAWGTLNRALNDNDTSLLDADFTGIAREKLADTIVDQQTAGLKTRYLNPKHDVSLVFYSPEGLSIELLDKVEYDVEVLDHDKLQATQRVRTQYIAVLTPTEVRWKVRILQSIPD